MYIPRVSIPSREGEYLSILDSAYLSTQLGKFYQLNTANVNLLIIAWVALLADSCVDPLKPNRVIHRFQKDLMNDLQGVVKSYSVLADTLVDKLERSGDTGHISAPYIPEMQSTPIFRDYLHFHKTGDLQSLRYVLSFLYFGKKAYFRDPTLDAVALRKWLEVEQRLDTLTLPDGLSNLRTIVEWGLRHWDADVFLPKHGNGAVSEHGVVGVKEKNRQITINACIAHTYLEPSIFRYDEPDADLLPHLTKSAFENVCNVARLKFVAKDYKTSRSICMEPIGTMWAQQGVRLWLEQALSVSEFGNHIKLERQEDNQYAAMFGSKTGLIDTIDLSAASDSVSWELVKAIFPPHVLRHLLATRTSQVVLPTKEIRTLNKFAPMGSALCFPTQSILYASVVILIAIAYRFGTEWDDPELFRGSSSVTDLYNQAVLQDYTTSDQHRVLPFKIYGDDITCDKRITSSVMDCLVSLGFKVNEDKSFTGSQAYRESCGKHYVLGEDVTPYYFKPKEIKPRISIASLSGVIDHANKALDFGYTHLRKHLVQHVLYYPIEGVNTGRSMINPVLFSRDPEEVMAILTAAPRNSHLDMRRWYPRSRLMAQTEGDKVVDSNTAVRYQRNEWRSITAAPETMHQNKTDDEYYHGLWWRSRYRTEQGSEGFSSPSSKAVALGAGVRWRWTAAG